MKLYEIKYYTKEMPMSYDCYILASDTDEIRCKLQEYVTEKYETKGKIGKMDEKYSNIEIQKITLLADQQEMVASKLLI